MTTSPVVSITDDLIAELELDVQVFTEMRMPGIMVVPGLLAALLAERADLKRQLAAASVDAERLDWLESAYGGHTGHGGGFHLSAYMPKDADTLREMIDAARDIAGSD